MAYYAYKNVRDLIPEEFSSKWIKEYEQTGSEKWPVTFDGDPNYDGDMWYLTAAYIEYLQEELVKAKEQIATTN